MKLSFKLNLLLSIYFISCLIVISAIYYFTVSSALETQIKVRADDNIRVIMEKFENFMFERLQDSKIIASTLPFKEEPLNLYRIAGRLVDYRNGWRTYSSIAFFDTKGKKLIDTNGLTIGSNYGQRLFFKEAMEKGTSDADEVSMSVTEKIPMAYFSCQVKGKKGNVIGVVVDRVPLIKLQGLVEKSIISQGVKRSEFYIDLLDQNKKILFSSRKGIKVLKDKFQEESILTVLLKGSKSGFIGVHSAPGLKEKYYTFFAVEQGHLDYKGNGRTLVLWMPEKYLAEPLNDLKLKVLSALIVSFFLSVFLASFVARRISSPLMEISKAADRIGRGSLGEEIAYKSDDELGQLAESFRKMEAELKKSQEKLIEQNKLYQKSEAEPKGLYGSLEEKVNEKTRDLVQTQEAVLNILDDAEAARKKLEETNVDLVKTKAELEEFSKNLEKTVEERTRELTLSNEELKRTSEKLIVADKVKSDFLANMSHELRTPLNSINGFSEVLYDETFGPLNEKQKKYVNNILTSGKHLLMLINQILDIAKIEAGKMKLKLSSVPIKRLLNDTSEQVAELALKKKLQMSLEIAEDLPDIEGDELRITEIIYNLLSNAIKFTPGGGIIGMRAKKTDGEIEIAVWDTGIGIAPENMEKIFEGFFRIDTPYARLTEGTGLGLPISKRLVELHGGKFFITSQGLDKGTEVRFTLPIGSGKTA